MAGQRQEAPVELAFLANIEAVHDGFGVVVNHALRHAAEEGEGAGVRVEQHFLRFARIGHHKQLAAMAQPEMSQFDGLRHTAQHDVLVAPVKLAGIARREHQRDECVGGG